MSEFRPMLAATCDDIAKLAYPLYASPKLDGVRAIVTEKGELRSRSLKPIPNPHVNKLLARKDYAGLDGELILGDPTAKDVYRQTVGAVSREYGEPGVMFHVFDNFLDVRGFEHRNRELSALCEEAHLVVVPQHLIDTAEDLLQLEHSMLGLGYEGLILRSPGGKYKMGRSTPREQGMLKLKRFVDSEAEIIEVEEELHNGNEAKKNALGRTERSTAQAGMVATGRAGALRVRDVKSGVEFGIGTGLNDEDRAFFWKNRKRVVGKLIRYKSFAIGVKDKPRFPIYLGPRLAWDL
jgi:DNA ligase-1